MRLIERMRAAAADLGGPPTAATVWAAYDLLWQATATPPARPILDHGSTAGLGLARTVLLGALMDAHPPLADLLPRPGPAALDGPPEPDSAELRSAVAVLLAALTAAIGRLPTHNPTEVAARARTLAALTAARADWP